MKLTTLAPDQLKITPFALWEKQWLLLTSGNYLEQKFNCMTIAWGSIGVMWNKPFVQVVVRPSRYTYGFMETYPDFTVCAFTEPYRKALQLLGSKSGRDGDKIAAAGLTPCQSEVVSTPAFLEANLIMECRKIYSSNFSPENFLDPSIHKQYDGKDHHKIYFGEVLTLRADLNFYS